MKPTDEQAAIYERAGRLSEGDVLNVIAFAGAGKTTTLKGIASVRRDRGVYLAFNRANADEAKKKLALTKCTASSFHGLAYGVLREAIGSPARLDARTVIDSNVLGKIELPRVDGGRDALLDGEALLGAGDADLSLAVSGIEIPAGELLPGHLLEKIRIGKDTRFDGRVSLGMALEGSRLRYGHDVDLTGLASSSASLELDLGQGNTFEDGLTGVMMAGSFVSGSFSHRDFGLASVIEAATGREMGDLLQQAVEVVPGPARLTAPVASWLTEALTGQGQVHAEPTNPVGLMQVGMMAAMAPANLVSLLELEVQ